MASMVVQLCQSGGGGKRVAPLGGAPFIASGGGWQRRRELRIEQWRQLCHGQGKSGGGHGPNAVGTGGAVVRTGRLTGGPQRFQIFPIYPKLAQL
jgi:hypothetical protein